MNTKFTNAIFVMIFMSALYVPMVYTDFSGGKVSEQERRTLAVRPSMDYAAQEPRDFIKQFDAWFSDNVGFRERFITLYNKMNIMYNQGFYLDGPSTVFIGKEGHHFHTHYNQLLPIYQGKPWLNDTQLNNFSIKLSAINQYLSERGIPFIFMLCTDKESVYWEYYPDFVIRGPEPAPLDKVTGYLSKHTDIDFFCIKERLLQEKERYLVYPKTGDIYELCHYNETGSFLAYQELMKHIEVYFPDMKPFLIEDVNIVCRINGSSSVSLKQELNYNPITPRFFEDALEFENNDPALPAILLLHDSYAGWFPNYLPAHFGKTIMLHYNSLERLEEYIDLYKPDIVVLESAERAIPGIADIIINSKLDFDAAPLSAISFGINGNASSFLITGFHAAEDGFRWTDGRRVTLAFHLGEKFKDMVAIFDIFPLLGGNLTTQRAEVIVNGTKVDDWNINKAGEKELLLPKSLSSDGKFVVTFKLPDAISPKELGINEDTRKLALGFKSMRLYAK